MSRAASFWDRRKAAVQAEEQAATAAAEQQALAEEHAALEEKTDAEILAELQLPDPDTLTAGDDFSAFMAKAVPDRIRRRALRVLWRSNPVLANVDMLVDYGEDFTDSATVVENLQTAYQVGKGMFAHVQEMARQEEARQNPTEPEIEPEQGQDEPQILAAHPEVEDAKAFCDVAASDDEAHRDEARDETEPTYVAPTPRRMKFSIEESAA